MKGKLIDLGYNFKSLEHISPYLEPTVAGTTAEWAKNIAMKYGCVVVAGYPEKAAASPVDMELTKRFNSAILVHPQGTTIANYRKSFLYYTDETWADESPDTFFSGDIEGLGRTVLGICMYFLLSTLYKCVSWVKYILTES